MSEVKDYILNKQENGSVLISQDVLVSIAALAVRDVEGVAALSGLLGADVSKAGKKNLSKGIKVSVSDNSVSIDCSIIVLYGHPVVEVAKNVQKAIADAIESMTGNKAENINVNVCGISAANR